MVTCPRKIRKMLSSESVIKVYNKYINETREIILGYGAYQHTKTGFFLKPSCPLVGNTFWPCLHTKARAEYRHKLVRGGIMEVNSLFSASSDNRRTWRNFATSLDSKETISYKKLEIPELEEVYLDAIVLSLSLLKAIVINCGEMDPLRSDESCRLSWKTHTY